MPTLLESIEKMVENITVTDRQEDTVNTAVENLDSYLTDEDSELFVEETFTNGSWERDTILRPLDDVDVFAVLDREEWVDEDGNLPNPQTVLTNFKDYLNGIAIYEGKVSQNRPCVTIELSKINFDVLPSFKDENGNGYWIPNHDLKSWTHSDPKALSQSLDDADVYNDYNLKKVVMAVKYWNRENEKLIPSFQIEESAISLFDTDKFSDLEEGIRLWFDNGFDLLEKDTFDSDKKYNTAKDNVDHVKQKLNEAKNLLDDDKEADAKKIWKEIFGKEFPTVDEEEAKNFARALSEGGLKIASSGKLSETVGKNITPSKGYYGEPL